MTKLRMEDFTKFFIDLKRWCTAFISFVKSAGLGVVLAMMFS